MQRPWVDLSSSEDDAGEEGPFPTRESVSSQAQSQPGQAASGSASASASASPSLLSPSPLETNFTEAEHAEQGPVEEYDNEQRPVEEEEENDEQHCSVEEEEENDDDEGSVEEEEENDDEQGPVQEEEEENDDEQEVLVAEEDEPLEEEEVQEEDGDHYFSVLSSLSEKWLNTQLTHNVSAAATNSFWKISMELIPKLVSQKESDNITRKTPTFTQERRKLYRDNCPPVKMTFAFKNKSTGNIETVDCDATPMNAYQRNPSYVKVFEEAHVEVITINNFFFATQYEIPIIVQKVKFN